MSAREWGTLSSRGSDDRLREQFLRSLLLTFVSLTATIAILGLSVGAYREAAISLVGGAVYAVMLAGLSRWGSRRIGYACTFWNFALATGAIASGRGIYDVTMLLFPAGLFIAARVLPRRHIAPVIALAVVIVVLVGVGKLYGVLPQPEAIRLNAADVAVSALLLLVSGVVATLVVRGVQAVLAQRGQAEHAAIRAKEDAEERNRSLHAVNQLARRLQRTLDLEEIGRQTIEVLVEHTNSQLVAFYLADEDGQSLRLVVDHGFGNERAVGARLPIEGSLSGLAMQTQSIVTSADVKVDPRGYRPVLEALARRGISTALAIPLVFNGTSLGTLNLLSPLPREYTALDLETFSGIAQAVSLAVANARLVAGLEFRAFHDTLTALPNRASLHRNFAAQAEGRKSVGLVLLDLNRFRFINEALGHHVGDELLQQIGSRFTDAVADSAEIYRLSGDEFAALIRRDVSVAETETIARKLVASLRQPFDVAGIALEAGAAAGVAHYPTHGRDSHELLRCADVALYRAKRTAGGVVVFSPELDEHTPARLALMSELATAIRDGGLELYFQPQVALATGAVSGFEALVRWPHPVRGMLLPAAFLPAAESTDVINPLTYWVVENAIRQLAAWSDTWPHLSMAINLSMRNLLDRNCPDRLEEIIARLGVDPSRVEFELTESAVLTDQETASSMLSRITATGAHLAIDDFGTGYSSLAYLRRFPVETIKIDRSFVADMLTRAQSRAIVASTCQLAGSLDLRVVAEGIENRPTADALREMHCDFAQGYYFAPPAPAQEVTERLAAHTLVAESVSGV